MAMLTKAYCRFFLGDPAEANSMLHHVLRIREPNANAAQLALIHSGLGISSQFLGRFEEARNCYMAALDLTRKVGDDSRISTIAANLCTTLMQMGRHDEAIRFGEMSVEHGEACSCSSLIVSYTNLIDPYMLLGREEAARRCIDKATEWIGPERRWKLRLLYYSEAASYALMQRNISLALDLIGQLENISRDREVAIAMPGAYWKLRCFRMAQMGQWREAYQTASSLTTQWKDSYVLASLDMIAAKAWLERKENGAIRQETLEDLRVFQRIQAIGKRDLLVLQGFLEPNDAADMSTGIENSQSDSTHTLLGRVRASSSAPRASFHTE